MLDHEIRAFSISIWYRVVDEIEEWVFFGRLWPHAI